MDHRRPERNTRTGSQVDDLDLLLRAHVLSLGDAPGQTLEVRDDWVQLTTPDARTHYRNGVHHAVLGAGEVATRIAATCRHYDALGVPFRWIVGPRSRPVDLADRLLRAGFVPHSVLCGFVLDVAAAQISAPDDVAVAEVHEPDVWVDVTARGWGIDPAGRARFRAQVQRSLAAQPPRERYYVATREGVPIGAASLLTAGAAHADERVAHLSGAVVLPDYRGRGVYRALLARRVADLGGDGFARAANLALSNTSAPICRSTGFHEVGRFQVLVR